MKVEAATSHIDAPHSGADVELISLSGWYAQELDAAVRP